MLHVNNWLHCWCQQQGFGLQGTQSEINVCLGEMGTKSLTGGKGIFANNMADLIH